MRIDDPTFERLWFSEWLSEPAVFGEATDLLVRLIDDDPEQAWLLIRRLVEQADSEVALQCVAAGPLEDLLCDHGPQFIDRAESAARDQLPFRRALATVWGHNRMAADVRRRVTLAAGVQAASE